MTEIIETNVGIRCQMCGVVNWPTALACMNCTATLDKRHAHAIASYSTIGAKSFSQKVARFFEIADYLMLLPATYGLLLALMLAGSAPWFTLIIVVSFAAGCYLLSGFFRHSRGRLSDSKVSRLWYATIAYNSIDLIAMLVFARGSGAEGFYLFSLWPLLVVILAALALSSENQRTNFNS